MKGKRIPINALRQRSLVACIAALCAAAASVPGFSSGVAAGQSVHAPATIVVTNCDDAGSGSLRDAVSNAANNDTIDLTQLSCSTISLSTGAIVIGQDSLGFAGPGANDLAIDAAASPGYAALYHLGGGGITVQGLTVENGSKYHSDRDARGGCIYSNGDVFIEHSRVTNCHAYSVSTHAALGGGVFAQGGV